ncbi:MULTISPECIES: hypothetical protein [unclassified Frondihabitans]|uniref:hypothetical protein n=1 Tax=unclassified Frondihabitans TaxID=2626248 RepID=UPI000F508DFA|nr:MULTISPECIES: hypothetical protein [unclassified Frondihabitans]RPE77887.1 hypothetical protein EDF37_0554 [Frondihabitans sp. PhB153]RPF08167.1 hypothetical protein EDF39_0555 [Frondihabitans sp. PhB161]
MSGNLDPENPGGVYFITTLSSSRYRLDLDALVIARFPDENGEELRRDDEQQPLLARTMPVIGQPLVMMIQIRDYGILTRRTTNWLTSIEKIG